MEAVHEYVPAPPKHNPFIDLVPEQGIRLTPKHYAYLKISEGCNHRCTFCIIPSMRGDLVSRPVGSVLDEAAALKRAGVKEVLVISQDTSAYGLDTKYKLDFWNGQPVKTKFYDMCEALGQLGIWVRLHYVYPYPHVDAVIDLMAQGKILPYLDIPFQHASPRILKLMKRPAHSENTLERLKLWREKCPELVIRSTFVVGFPGETEEDFVMLLDWLQEAKLDRVGCFTYSPVEGATANDLPDHVPEEIKQQRYERFMEVQQAISAEKLQKRIGQTMTVLVDDLEEEFPVAVARSYADAPEIDGNVFVEDIDKSQIKAGDLLEVEITDADEFRLDTELEFEMMDSKKPRYERILLKLSGEALAGNKDMGIDAQVLDQMSLAIAHLVGLGVQVGIVVGGGNLYRGSQLQQDGLVGRVTGDQMGMLATVMNGLALRDALVRRNIKTRLMSALPIGTVVESYSSRDAIRHLTQGEVCVFVAGTGNPFFTTDTAACLRGIEIEAHLILKATKVDGVYNKDPSKFDDAVKYDTLTFDQVLDEKLGVMDLTAICLCRDHNVPLQVFDMNKTGSLLSVVMGEKEGTHVTK